jgi:hypothetical protein
VSRHSLAIVIAVALAYAAQAHAQAPANEPLARYGSGWLRFTFEGRKYDLPITRLIDPETRKPRPSPSRLEKFKDSQGGTFHSLSLDFGEPGPESATLSIMVRDVGEYPPELAPVGFEINFRVGGVFVTLGGRSFPGCTLEVSRLDAKGAKGALTCPRPPPSGVGAIEFSVAP